MAAIATTPAITPPTIPAIGTDEDEEDDTTEGEVVGPIEPVLTPGPVSVNLISLDELSEGEPC